MANQTVVNHNAASKKALASLLRKIPSSDQTKLIRWLLIEADKQIPPVTLAFAPQNFSSEQNARTSN